MAAADTVADQHGFPAAAPPRRLAADPAAWLAPHLCECRSELGHQPEVVSGRLGHSTVAFTLDVYSHVLPQADEEAAVRIAALVRPRS